MSVFTSITSPQLEIFLQAFNVGELKNFTGIQAGITNTNYFVDTTTGRYVLTIVENESAADVEWFMQLLDFLYQAKIPCAQPLKSDTGHYTGTLANKPATLVNCLPGADKTAVNPADCQMLGKQMAEMHLACRNYPSARIDSRGAAWRDSTSAQVLDRLNQHDSTLLNRELALQHKGLLDTLPRSIIHADLFRDNVLFDGDKISGIIDVYYACDGCMLYDLAIAYNDWVRHPTGEIDADRAIALLQGYESVRPWHDSEKNAWPVAVRAAALRFWLSRLQDLHFPPDGAITHTKDPAIFQTILDNSGNYPAH